MRKRAFSKRRDVGVEEEKGEEESRERGRCRKEVQALAGSCLDLSYHWLKEKPRAGPRLNEAQAEFNLGAHFQVNPPY